MHRRSFILLALLLTLATTGLSAQTISVPAERAVFDSINRIRLEHRLCTLAWDPALALAARQHALRSLQEPPSLEHQYRGEPDLVTRAVQAGAHFSSIAENLARGNRSATDLVALWMTTPIHRGNILNPDFNATGISVVQSNGLLYAVQDFSHASPMLGPDALEQRLSALLLQQGVPSAAPSAAARTVCEQHGTASPGARLVVGWDGNAASLPSVLLQQLAHGSFRRAAIGVCASDRPPDGFPNAHVTVLLF